MTKEINEIYYHIDFERNIDGEAAVNKAHNELMNYLIDNKMPEKIKLPVDDLICAVKAESERSGFVIGFKYAIRLLTVDEKAPHKGAIS